MSPKIDLYNLDKKGVNTDRNQIQLEDGHFTKAQNATTDPLGSEGGIRKRPGLTKVNSIAAAGSVIGWVQVPIAKPTTREFYAGQYTGTTPGWNVSTDAFDNAVTTGGPDGFDTSAVPRLPTNVWTNLANSDDRQYAFAGRPSVMYKNRFFYAGNDYTVGTTAPTIRVWDGTTDRIVTYIPNNPDTSLTQASAILCMITGGGKIYISTYDGGSYAGNTVKGRVFQLDPENNTLLQIGARFPTDGARSIYSLAWHMKRLWTATFTGGVSATQKVYWTRPGIDTGWTQDTASMGANGPVTEMMSFQGLLYLGSIADASAAALMRVRSTAGAYSTSRTVALNEGGAVPTMTDFGTFNHFGAMTVFQSALYATYFNKNAADTNLYARIYKYDGTSWTIPYSPAANAATAVPYQSSIIHNNQLFFLSAPSSDGSGNLVNKMLRTADGTTWTDVSSDLANTSASAFGVITS